jgi:hypothetical protein
VINTRMSEGLDPPTPARVSLWETLQVVLQMGAPNSIGTPKHPRTAPQIEVRRSAPVRHVGVEYYFKPSHATYWFENTAP